MLGTEARVRSLVPQSSPGDQEQKQMLTPPSPVLTPERSGPQARPLPELPLPRPWWARSDSGSGQDREAHRRGGEGAV